MPSVSVVLKNGTAIEVEGANDAEWRFQRIAEGADRQSLMLFVYAKEPNKTETRGKFLGDDVVGFTIDVR